MSPDAVSLPAAGEDVGSTRPVPVHRLVEECFLIEHAGHRLAYFPRHARVLAVTLDAWRTLERLNDGLDDREVVPFARPLLHYLDRVGLLADGDRRPTPSAPSARPEPYAPTRAALLLTDRCNLRCVYCYSNAGASAGLEMPIATALAAVDLIVENALQTGEGPCMVQFHGGGEPTCAWKPLVRVVEHLEARTRREGLPHFVGLTTNGVIPRKRLMWIAEHVDDLCISIDGPRAVQDRQRPKLSGAGSFDDLRRTLDFLDRRECQYYTLSTVTGESAGSLPDLVNVVAGRPGCTAMFVEPVFGCGRFTGGDATVPTEGAFVAAFRATDAAARPHGIPVRYAGARSDTLTERFCETPTPAFTVTPAGDVTACYMVTERNHPRADLFFHGTFDRGSGRYHFDPEARERLRSHHVDNIPACRQCFCKHHCAGGCLHQAPALGDVNDFRCRVTHTLTADQLVATLAKA